MRLPPLAPAVPPCHHQTTPTQQSLHAGIEEIEATREAYATEALLMAVADVVALYRGGGAALPPRLPALDRLAAAYESYTRLSSVYTPDAAAGSGQPPTT